MNGQEKNPGDSGPEEPDEFDEAAFEAAFAAEFGEAVEPDRKLRDESGNTESAGTESAGTESAGTESAGTESAGTESAGSEDPSGADEPSSRAEPASTSRNTDEPAGSDERRRVLAVVLTPIASAQVLAALCSMAKIDADIVPTKRGALAAKIITTSGELDPGELLTGAPSEATQLAETLSGTTKLGVVLLTARLGDGEDGVTGTISARSFENGTEGEEVAPGLILAQSDDVVEQILIGSLAPADAKGRLVPNEMSRWQAARVMAKQMKRRKP